MKRRTDLTPYLLITPAQLLLLLTIFVPSIYIAWLSLHKSTFGADAVFVGLDNFVVIFTDPIFWRSFVNTFVVVNFIVWGELLLGLGVALLLSGRLVFKKFIFSVVIAPYAVTVVSAVVIWRYLLEPEVGLVNYGLMALGLNQLDWVTDPVHGLAVAGLISIWIHLPFTIIILYSALTTVPSELIEAARVDGAGSWQVFRRVTLPTIMPAILVALMFRFIFAMRLFTEVWLLTEGGPARQSEVLAVYLFRAAFRYNEFGVSAATGLAMQLLSLAVASFYLRQLYLRMKSEA